MKKEQTLSSGQRCFLLPIKGQWIPHYYVLAFPRELGEPTAQEVQEMMVFAIDFAKKMALEHVGNAESCSLIYSGYSARREKGWHLHIVLLKSRWWKAWLYFVLFGKNLMQAVRLRKDDAYRP